MRKLLLIIFLIAGICFGYRGYLCLKLDSLYREIDNDSFFSQELVIKKNDEENEKLILSIDSVPYDISLRNDFLDYEEREDAFVKYVDGDVSSSIIYSIGLQYINLLTSKSLSLDGSDDQIFNEEDRISFLSNNNIKNDIELLEYIKDNYYFKSNIFMTTKKIKQNYMLNELVNVGYPSFDSVTLIKGDYLGYIFNINDNIREVHLLKDDYQCYFTLIGNDLIKDDYIVSLIGSVIFIEKE